MILRTILEFAATIAVLFGICHEDKLVEWEDRLIERLKR